MAKLFGKEYHEHSNSWYFKNIIINLKKNDLIYRKFLDENKNLIFLFESTQEEFNKFPVKLEIAYNPEKRKVVSHKCSEDGFDVCKHYLSVLNYCYNYLSTDILEHRELQTYQTKLMRYNEYWQRVTLNSRIEISDIYNRQNDKIRIYFNSYYPIDIRIIAIYVSGRTLKNDDQAKLDQVKREMKALSESEIELLKKLHKYKCSFSRKGYFFTIYKKDFIYLFPNLISLKRKIFIRETGDRLKFSDEEFRINFQVTSLNNGKYLMRRSSGEKISEVFVGYTTYILKKNVTYSINLPFEPEVTKEIFKEGFKLKNQDLVYLSSIVARQLGLIKCYIDFAEDIEIPEVYHNTPIITYYLKKENNSIILDGLLDYSSDITIPMSVIRFPAELVRYDQNGEVSWFYIPPQVKHQIVDFIKKLPDADTSMLEKKSQLIFNGEENMEMLKKVIFEHGNPEWNIILSEELKKEFIYKVNLEPIVRAKKTDKISWFEYEVEYHYKDISFSHEELRKFFSKKEKFLKLEDGRLLFLENKEAYDDIDNLLNKSSITTDKAYKLSIYNLPYLYQLPSINKGIHIKGDLYLEQMFNSIISRELPEKLSVSSSLRPIMRTYQKAGFRWLKMLEKYSLSGILADDMGLGKTVQAISVLSDLPSDFKSIVICPKTLLYNWGAEFQKFNNNITYLLYEGNQQERARILDNLNVNVLLASYSIIQNDVVKLSEIEFDYIILDEAQHIKNSSALRTKAVKKLRSRHKMALSGTPIENNPVELWSIFDFLMPGYLEKMKNFKKPYTSNEENVKLVQNKLKNMVSPFILRRLKKDVLIELPDKQIQLAFCKLAPIQEKMYLQVLDNINSRLSGTDGNGNNYLHVLAALTKMRQICNHPALLDDAINPDSEFSGKLEMLREIIVDAVENNRKLLIFSQFVRMLKLIRKLLKDLEIPYEYMDGSVKDRQKRIDNFSNNNNIRAFLISLKTGGYGLNLTAADTVIIVDPWWNPMGENQAIDRAHRIGQTRKVLVYKLITKGTIEEKILSLQQSKKDLFDNIIEDGQNVVKSLTINQLKNLLEYND